MELENKNLTLIEKIKFNIAYIKSQLDKANDNANEFNADREDIVI
jgi:hypothetical protein